MNIGLGLPTTTAGVTGELLVDWAKRADAGPFTRMARYADGHMHGGGPPRAFGGAVARALTAWSDLGRPGRPALWGMGYFALGDGAAEAGAEYLRHYYAFTGSFADKIAAGNLTSP